MKYLPIFVDLRDAPCLVVGGGAVAARRVALLREAHAVVTVLSPELGEELRALVAEGGIEHRPRPYGGEAELHGMRLVVGATDDAEVNRQVSEHARARGVPVNVVDAPALCSFIMPAVVDREPVTVAISTGGASPVLARLTRGRLEAALPPQYGELARLAARYRAEVKQRIADPVARRRLWEQALDGRVAALVLAGRIDEAQRELEAMIGAGGARGAVTRVVVVFGGDGDVQQQSLRALSRLGGADLVVHPERGMEAIVGLARRDATRVSAPRQEGAEGVVRAAVRALQDHAGLGLVCVVLDGLAGAGLEPALAALGAHGELELVHPAPR